jgi:Domain of unknown function (DUF4288)
MNDSWWFSVRVLFESLHPEEPGLARFFEDRIILIRADTGDEARKKATAQGKSAEHSYESAHGDRVDVVFREILDVQDLIGDALQDGAIRDGAEIYYQFLNEQEVERVKQSLEPGSADRRWPEPSKTRQ